MPRPPVYDTVMFPSQTIDSRFYYHPCDQYRLSTLVDILSTGVRVLGGRARLFPRISDHPHPRILLKPNLLKGASWERAVNTHPLLLEAVIRLFLDLPGVSFTIADSPGIGNCRSAARVAGYRYLTDKYPVVIRNISDHRRMGDLFPSSENSIFRNLPVWSYITGYDFIINLAKLKTHGQLGMTLCVKNLFGLVPGTLKAAQHFHCGTDHQRFSRMLIDLCLAVSPSFHIIDAVLSMEGNGPGSGTPRQTGFVAMGRDPFAVDLGVSRMTGFRIPDLPVLKTAREMGYPFSRVRGLHPEDKSVSIRNFQPARPRALMRLTGLIPPWLNKTLRHILTDKPVIRHDRCNRCLLCVRHCAAGAMSLSADSLHPRVLIQHKKCIKCYCCQELCPRGAIRIRPGILSVLSR